MATFLHAVVLAFVSVSLTSGQTTTTAVTKKFLFEKVCEDVYGTVIANYYKIRDRAVCGTTCAKNPSCISFLYKQTVGWCSLNSVVFVNRTDVGCPSYKLEDYAEVTTKDPLRFPPVLPLSCPGGACTNEVNGFRLCDGGGAGVCNERQGRLEYNNGGVWGTVCDDYWLTNEPTGPFNAKVACRSLGYYDGVTRPFAYFGAGVGDIWIDDIMCAGTESSLLDCFHLPIGNHNCGHSEDQGVTCYV